MSAAYPIAQEGQALFALADELYATTKTALSTGDLLHAPHDEVERFAVEQGRRIVRELLQSHLLLRGQAESCAPVIGADGEARTQVRHDTTRPLVTMVGRVEVHRIAYSGRELVALHPVDAELNLPEHWYSLEVQRLLAKTSAEVSFARASELFHDFTRVHIGLRQVEEIAQAAAVDMEC